MRRFLAVLGVAVLFVFSEAPLANAATRFKPSFRSPVIASEKADRNFKAVCPNGQDLTEGASVGQPLLEGVMVTYSDFKVRNHLDQLHIHQQLNTQVVYRSKR